MDEKTKQAIISALRYQYDGVDGKEEEHEFNNATADKLEKGQLGIFTVRNNAVDKGDVPLAN